MTFDQWITDPKRGARLPRWWMAEIVGCSIPTIYRLSRPGARPPEEAVMYGIARLTGGQVQPNDWYPDLAKVLRARIPAPPADRRRGWRRTKDDPQIEAEAA